MEKASDSKTQNSEKIPLKLGLRCHPPALTLLYQEGGKKRLRQMPVRFLTKFGSVERVVEDMTIHHQPFLKNIPRIRIEKILKILQEVEKGLSIEEASKLVGKQYSIDPNQDLNKLNDEELSTKKKVMDQTFHKNQLKEGDEDYVYDIQVDFTKESKEDAGWDTEADEKEDFWT